jgi:hypothetical protein
MKFNKQPGLKAVSAALAIVCGLAASSHATAAATIVINNLNAAGVGFNDNTPAAPVGGNNGTTLGQQRQIAFSHAANIWGATLTSSVPIIINAQFTPLSCTATGATLGSAGATNVFTLDDVPNTKPGTLYSYALTNKLIGEDALGDGSPQINARFNSDLGKADCLTGTSFYLGLDANHGANIDFVATLLHEMGHGLGFQTFTDGATGAQLAGFPSIWDHYLLDNTTNKLWVDMVNSERAASSLKNNGLSWTGANVVAAAPNVLSHANMLRISGPSAGAAAGSHESASADFGPALTLTPITGQVMPVVDQPDGSGLACTPLSASNALAVRGNIALVNRGVCTFTVKVKNAQDAGAIAVLVANNVSEPISGLGGTDASITIPSVRITLQSGAALKTSLSKRSRTASGVFATIGLSPTELAGSDSLGRPTMYTPNPYQPGSSVSHYNTSARRNQLMEPAISADLTHSVTTPLDLTFELLKDIGW